MQAAAEHTEETLSDVLVAKGLTIGDPLYIRIFKDEAELEVWLESDGTFTLLRTYEICYFSGELGPKLEEGDRQSPEGFYIVTRGNMNPNSRYHLAFNIGYPNRYDRAHGRTGSAIMVHGSCGSIGCYAMTDPVIEEIYTIADAALSNGQPHFRVDIFPFRMTEDNLRRTQESRWIDFWRNLKPGYDYFETRRVPPSVRVENKQYVVETLSQADI